jgi:Ni/Co efflux regulator RcnB
MKKILFALVLAFCFAVPYAAQAQVVEHPRHHHHHHHHHHHLNLNQ